MREWESTLREGEDEAASMERGGSRKKAIKGDAFIVGLSAFAGVYGWGT